VRDAARPLSTRGGGGGWNPRPFERAAELLTHPPQRSLFADSCCSVETIAASLAWLSLSGRVGVPDLLGRRTGRGWRRAPVPGARQGDFDHSRPSRCPPQRRDARRGAVPLGARPTTAAPRVPGSPSLVGGAGNWSHWSVRMARAGLSQPGGWARFGSQPGGWARFGLGQVVRRSRDHLHACAQVDASQASVLLSAEPLFAAMLAMVRPPPPLADACNGRGSTGRGCTTHRRWKSRRQPYRKGM